MSWPKQYGGQEIEGIYEFILNEALARHAAPQIGKGVGIIGKTLIRHGSDEAQGGVPAQDPARRDRVRGRLQRAAGRLGRREHAAQGREGGRRLEAQRPEDVDHLGALRGLVLGGRAHRSGQAEARRALAVPDPDEAPRARGPEPADDRQGHHQPGLLHGRVRSRRLPGRASAARASSTSPRRSTSSASRCSRSRRSPIARAC